MADLRSGIILLSTICADFSHSPPKTCKKSKFQKMDSIQQSQRLFPATVVNDYFSQRMNKFLRVILILFVVFGCSSQKKLVLDLPLDQTIADKSVYQHVVVKDNTVLTNDRLSRSSHAREFDSTTTYIQIRNSKTLDNIKTITLSAWVKPVAFFGVGNNTIINKGFSPWGNPYYQYHLGITGSQRSSLPASFVFAVSVNNEYTYVTTPAGEWTPGQWYHVAGTYDGRMLKLYINGVERKSLLAPGRLGHFGNDVFIGTTNEISTKSSNTPGTFDEIRIYKKALTAKQINRLFLEKNN